MIKADRYFRDNLSKLSVIGTFDKNPRPKYKDGTPARTKYITQVWEEYNLNNGEFPITTLRNTAIKNGIQEILWIYQDQDSSLSSASKRDLRWWDNWNIGDGTIGGRYGDTVNRWKLIDKLLKGLKENPFSRRHIINLWQEYDREMFDGGLDPCAYETIFSVVDYMGEMFLDMTLIQRSSDYIMAGYINKIQYVALQMMIAHHLGYKVGKFCHLVQNLHIYDRHIDAANEILERKHLDFQPKIKLVADKNKGFYDIGISDFEIHTSKDIKKINSELEIAI